MKEQLYSLRHLIKLMEQEAMISIHSDEDAKWVRGYLAAISTLRELQEKTKE